MKPVLLAALLLAFTSPALADDPETCVGRVKIDAVENELAGGKIMYVGECMFLPPMLPKRILRSCPAGSYCRIEGVSYGEGEVAPEINTFTSATRIDPYREGVRDYRAGLCYRARPYRDGSPEQKQWERGYNAHPTRKQTKRMDEICFPGRIH